MANPQPDPDVGALAASSANSYAILAKLATGGMAEIFLARTASTAGVERYVVLKRVLPERLKDTNFVAMFLDEARLAAQLQHPNIAQVFDTGKLGDSYFFSMEYVHGETVRELIYKSRLAAQPIPIGCALTIIANAASGLHHAHERLGLDGKPLGIVHRDVSPSNLMVSYEGNVKVVDFGVAKTALRTAETQTGTVKGKIGYLSPEQCRGRASDRRSDLFSLGIVLWELLVGERLYKRANDYDTMEAIVLDPPTPPSKLRAEVPASLDAIVLKLLAKAPGDRYQTADELHEDIERVADAANIRISTATLKRFVVELFGKRPEPWIEQQVREAVPEIVTVSAAVGSIDTVLTTLNNTQLSNILDLTKTPSAPRRTPTPVAFMSVDDLADADAPNGGATAAASATSLKPRSARRKDVQATLHVRRTDEPSRIPLVLAALGVVAILGGIAWFVFFRAKPDAPSFSTSHDLLASGSGTMSGGHAGSDTMSGGHLGSDSNTGSNVSDEHVRSDTASGKHVGSDTMSGEHVGSDTASGEHVGSDTASGEHVGSDTASGLNTVPDGKHAKKPKTKAELARDAKARADAVRAETKAKADAAHEAKADAARDAKADAARDAKAKADAARDAKAKVDVAGADAAQKAKADAAQKKPDAAKQAADDFAANVRAGKHSDVVVSCLVNAKLLAQNIAACTIAACQGHDATNARAWFGNVPAAKRDAVSSTCAAAGTPLVVKASTCETDPSSCAEKPKCTDPMECRK